MPASILEQGKPYSNPLDSRNALAAAKLRLFYLILRLTSPCGSFNSRRSRNTNLRTAYCGVPSYSGQSRSGVTR